MSLAASRPVGRTLTAVVVGLIAAALPATALGQATRTWVSGVGDDANPCSRTAPCKTFAGAISKTAAKGEINVLDPGGFGGVTITKSITISGHGVLAGVLVSGTNGIIVNAGSTDRVVLRGLDINGVGTGLAGVKVLQAKSVRVVNSQIFGFTNGIELLPTAAAAQLYVQDTEIYDNAGDGIVVGPSTRATLRRVDLDGNGCGIVAAVFGLPAAPDYTQNCGASLTGTPGTASISAFRTTVAGNAGAGASAVGAGAVLRLSGSEVSENGIGLKAVSGGAVLSFGNNAVAGNDVDGNPTGRIQLR
ncbi:MAG: hypothetical protein QOH30_2418 [Baekduia sp.]|jgi:hypothetical protein|nr:hypothetical protein [Baekduia sp.]